MPKTMTIKQAKKFVREFIAKNLKKRKTSRTEPDCSFEIAVEEEAIEEAAELLIIKQDKENQLFVADTDYQAALVVVTAATIARETCQSS